MRFIPIKSGVDFLQQHRLNIVFIIWLEISMKYLKVIEKQGKIEYNIEWFNRLMCSWPQINAVYRVYSAAQSKMGATSGAHFLWLLHMQGLIYLKFHVDFMWF